jgi:hypothetical protein
MTTALSQVVQQAGLVEGATVEELQRWGAPIERAQDVQLPAESVGYIIERAVQSADFVEIRETDLEVLHHYLSSATEVTLHIEHLDGTHAEIVVNVGSTPEGKCILPWTGEHISDALLDCILTLPDYNTSLHNPRELFYGNRKMFVVWEVLPL